MSQKRELDEYLEWLWHMDEWKKDTLAFLETKIGSKFNIDTINLLCDEGFVELRNHNTVICFTAKGREKARHIIRAHRLAERLFQDVLGYEIESGACEFEHTVTLEIVNSICILLGHPRQCPHGMSIPKGECCEKALTVANTSVKSVLNMHEGESARVAYIYAQNNQLLNQINSMQIIPGSEVTLQQKNPVYILECEGATVALDMTIVAHMYVWKR